MKGETTRRNATRDDGAGAGGGEDAIHVTSYTVRTCDGGATDHGSRSHGARKIVERKTVVVTRDIGIVLLHMQSQKWYKPMLLVVSTEH